MSPPTIRPATADDIAAVAALEREIFAADAWSAALVEDDLLRTGRRSFVAAAPDVVGYAITARAEDFVDLLRIAVAPSHRRSGVARALLEAAQRQARQDGAHRMLLEVAAHNEAALGFYAAAGFVEIDRRRRYYRDGSDAVVMRLSLGSAACGRSA